MSRNGVRLVEPDQLQAIRGDWEELWTRTPNASPFQSPAWLLPWAEVYAPNRCRAAGLWREDRLAAAVAGFVWERKLLLAGTGPSDHASALFSPGSDGAAADLLAALADGSSEPFDCVDLQQLAPESALVSIELDRFVAVDAPGDPSFPLLLDGEDGMTNVPARMRGNWRYALRRFEREGVRVEAISPDRATEAAGELERLHALRWRAEGEDGVLADGLAGRHLNLAIPQLARAGLLRMHRVRSGAETIAILFAMRGKQSTCYYLSGFDPEWASFSPGTVLVGAAIAEAAREGCTAFDFLRGEEDYKRKWGAKEMPRVRRVLTRA